MKRDADAQKLKAIIDRIVETRRVKRGVNPSWVATQALVELDPKHWVQGKHPMVYKAAHLELRQMAREACRDKWNNPEAGATDSHPLFPELQWRYPVARDRGAEPEYVLLEHLTDTDVAFNVARLRSVSVACSKHADALEAWGRGRPKAA
jgi:hypothetical protein